MQSVCFGGRFTSSFVTASLRKSWRRLCGTARTFQPRSGVLGFESNTAICGRSVCRVAGGGRDTDDVGDFHLALGRLLLSLIQ